MGPTFQAGAVEAIFQVITWEPEKREILHFLRKKKHPLHSQAWKELALFHDISYISLFQEHYIF